ncbi:hypothetical protein BCR44DRAFT_1445467 [Catenaria anguillulae PL171]|uniref:Ankyrin repeat-containing domain protein n=1 Tax=Catenaria anguillulae PL171 TaxID=765915 RepID=A0A1Y2H8F1_9FUNG|nr:hypothetical protein BCR44DRAFT_1445467 [Catenaria anguillulae PL171]
MNTLSSDMLPTLAQPPLVAPPPSTPPPPQLPHELTQLILILAAHSLVICPTSGSPLDFPDPHLLTHLALVSPDNYTALQQFIFLNVPWCSLHDAGRRGDLALMRWWLDRSGVRISQSGIARALFEASQAGHVHVLDSFKSAYPDMEVDPRHVRHILRAATSADQPAVIEWWIKQSGFDLASIPKQSTAWQEYVYDAFAANSLPLVKLWAGELPVDQVFGPTKTIQLPANAYAAVSVGCEKDCSVLQWIHDHVQDFGADLVSVTDWGSPRISLRYLAHAGLLTLLQWFLEKCRIHSVPEEKVFTHEVLRAAVDGEQVAVLQWWIDSGLPLHVPDSWSVDSVTCPATLTWIASSGVPFHSTEAAVDTADSVAVLDWWLAHSGSSKLKYTDLAMDRASAEGRVDLLDWWVKSGCELKYSSQSFDLAAESGHLDVLEWWLASDLEFEIHTPLTLATRGNHLDVMDWLWEHELYNKGAEEELAVFESISCRNLDALRWWEARAWPTDPHVIDCIGRKLYDDEFEGGPGEVQEYGLKWWFCHSKMLDEDTKGRLTLEWQDWEIRQQGYYMEVSDEDDEQSEKVERWWVDVEEEIPFLDFGKAK